MDNEEIETKVDENVGNEELEAALAEEQLEEINDAAAEGDDAEKDGGDTKSSDSKGDDSKGDDSDDDKEPDEALEELEAAELEIEDDPATILIDEAAEIREMRRDELGLIGGQEMQSGEFLCTECFLMKAATQLANKSRKVCADCV